MPIRKVMCIMRIPSAISKFNTRTRSVSLIVYLVPQPGWDPSAHLSPVSSQSTSQISETDPQEQELGSIARSQQGPLHCSAVTHRLRGCAGRTLVHALPTHRFVFQRAVGTLCVRLLHALLTPELSWWHLRLLQVNVNVSRKNWLSH